MLNGSTQAPAVTIAVAGAGLIGRRHIELITSAPGCELAAVVDPAAQAAELARTARVPWYPSLGEMLAQGRPDGVILATPNTVHAGQGMACVEAGLPVLVEKPIAGTVEDALPLVAAAERASVPLLVGHHRRHSPLLSAARLTVASGQLGEVVAVMGSAVFYKPDYYFEEGPWRREPGGGPILVNMIHEVDDLRFICGDIAWVSATASNRTRGFAVEDTVAITIGFTSGALATFMLSDAAVCSRSWEQTSGENQSYPQYADEDCYVVAGTRGSLSVPTMRIRRHRGSPSWWTPTEDAVIPVDRSDPLENQLRHFCAVIRGDTQPLVTGRDAIESLRVTQAIAQSAAEGRRITCGPDTRDLVKGAR